MTATDTRPARSIDPDLDSDLSGLASVSQTIRDRFETRVDDDFDFSPANLPAIPDQATLEERDSLPDDYRRPWDRNPRESDEAWAYFSYFRSLPIGSRVHLAVADHFGVAGNTVYRHAKNHDWVDRLAAYDQYEDQIYQAQRVTAIREMADRHALQLVEALEILAIPQQAIARRLENDPTLVDDMSKASFKQLMNYVLQASRVVPSLMSTERLTRGMPTDILQVNGEMNVHHDFDRQQIAEITAALAAAGAFDDGRGAFGSPEIIDAEVVEVHPEDSDT